MYQGPSASPSEIAIAMSRLKAAFSKMDNSFFNLLTERVISNNFSAERLKDAINQILDHYKYKELSIADIIQYDKKVKLYSHSEVCSMVSKGIAEFKDFEIREINGEFYRVKKIDLV